MVANCECWIGITRACARPDTRLYLVGGVAVNMPAAGVCEVYTCARASQCLDN